MQACAPQPTCMSCMATSRRAHSPATGATIAAAGVLILPHGNKACPQGLLVTIVTHVRCTCHACTGVAHLGTSALLKSCERCCTTTVPTNTHIVSARGPGHTGRKTSDAFCNTHACFSAFNTAHTITVMYSKQQYRHTTGIRNKVQTSALASAPSAHEGAHGACSLRYPSLSRQVRGRSKSPTNAQRLAAVKVQQQSVKGPPEVAVAVAAVVSGCQRCWRVSSCPSPSGTRTCIFAR